MSYDELLVKVAEVIGKEEAIQIACSMKNAGEITDDVIVSKTGIRLNTVRKILYKLYDHSIVSLSTVGLLIRISSFNSPSISTIQMKIKSGNQPEYCSSTS